MPGYPNKLYILPFDHRASFTSLLGFSGKLSPEQLQKVKDFKRVVYDGFLKIYSSAPAAQKKALGILIDEQYGEEIIKDALSKGIVCSMTVEKSGQELFDFEYGKDYGRHLSKFKGTIAKVLVRYNPENSKENPAQVKRLKEMCDHCAKNRILFLFELLVIPTAQQLAALNGDKHSFDLNQRPKLMKQAIAELQSAGVEPDIWKIEALDTAEDWKLIERQIHKGKERKNVAIIVLGRGESDEKVRKWLSLGASISGTSGFAVGRTVFSEPLIRLREGKLSRKEAVDAIANNYQSFIDLWESSLA
ncbi:MAG TPA: DUF2090 domain-containing protein [Candidatus Nanoarchaeia archaeon]|nr:DUF2090 domain-containing protein [Candidatus Nanoarchaeia archaeon]